MRLKGQLMVQLLEVLTVALNFFFPGTPETKFKQGFPEHA